MKMQKYKFGNDNQDIDLNLVSYLSFFDGSKYDKWDKNQKQFL